MKVTIVIPTWNGVNLLKKNLNRVLETGPDEIIIVDDGSTDDSVKLLNRFKNIKLIKHYKNLGFVKSVNNGVESATGDIIILLNNDVTPDKNFIEPLTAHFKDDKVFAVSCHEEGYSWAWAKFKNGFVEHGMGKPTTTVHDSFWASGGSATFDRKKWVELGGMDELYSPFYWEDIDICYRAQKRGWKILWEPDSIVKHEHESTISKYFSKSYISYISQRNQLIFIWKNVTSDVLFMEHKKALLGNLVKGNLRRPFLGALVKFPDIYKKRKIEIKNSKVSDEEIFRQFVNI